MMFYTHACLDNLLYLVLTVDLQVLKMWIQSYSGNSLLYICPNQLVTWEG